MSLPTMPIFRTQREYTIPQLHFVTIVLTAVILVILLLLYAFSPTSKEGLYVSTIGLIVGFLTGKLSNSFNKPIFMANKTNVRVTGTSESSAGDAGGTIVEGETSEN